MIMRSVLLSAAVLVGALVLGADAVAAQERRAPAGQEEFVPIAELEGVEQLPAAPLVIAAYAVIWVGVFIYLWTIWRRVGAVEREIGALRRRLADKGPSEPRSV